MRTEIVLVTVCDDHFSVMMAALLKSIEITSKSNESILIYLIDDGISKHNKNKIQATISGSSIKLIWISMAEAIPQGVSLPIDNSLFPIGVYARICIPYFLPKHIKKAIYLDADTLVVRDIKELWDIDLQGYAIAAVIDRSETVDSSWAGIPNYAELGIPGKSKYFNSGVLVIDVDKWRDNNVPNAVFECVKNNLPYASFPDQYGLNVYFANQWYELDPRWNSFAQCDLPDPYIIHFIGRKPIYREYRYNKDYSNRFYTYLRSTPFHDFKPYGKYYRLGNKAIYLARKKMLKLRKYLSNPFSRVKEGE